MIQILSKYVLLSCIAFAITGSIQAQKYTLSYESQDETLDPSIQKGIESAIRALTVPVEGHATEGSHNRLPLGINDHHANETTTIDLSLGNILTRSSSDEVFLLVFEAGSSDVPLMAKSVQLMSLPRYVVFSNIDLLDPLRVASELRHVEVVARIYGKGSGSSMEKNIEIRSRPIDLFSEPLPFAIALNEYSSD